MADDDILIIDAVTHAYNHSPENFADEVGAGAVVELAYVLSREIYLSD
jgi:hypothetical protein